MSQNNRYSILQINTSSFTGSVKPPFKLEEVLSDQNVFTSASKFMFKFNNIISSAQYNVIQTNQIFMQIFNILIGNDVITEEDLENRLILKKWLIILDFKGDHGLNVDEDTFDKIFKNGFDIKFEDEEDYVHFVNFEKSPSMTKKCQLSFIREELAEPLKGSIDVGFKFDKQYEISKVYAYRGLMFTDGYPIGTAKDLGLDIDSVVIVKDNKCELTEKFNYITAVNQSSIDAMLQDENLDIQNLINALDAYKIFDDISNEDKKSKLTEALKELNNPTTESLLNYLKINAPKSLSNPNNWERVEQYGSIGELNVFDGAGLIDDEFAADVELEYKAKRYNLVDSKNDDLTSFQIRMPYMKGMVHRCDIKKFYREHGITEIEDFLGNKRKVENIKMLLTVSQFKCASWILKDCSTVEDQNAQLAAYWRSLYNYEHTLFITSQVNKPNIKDNDKTNYQLLHTTKMTMREFCEFKKQYEDRLIKLKFDKDQKAAFFANLDPERNTEHCLDENNYFYKLTKKNKDFIYFPPIKAFLKDVVDGFIKQYAIGRIAYTGEIRFFAPDLLELLYHAGKIPYDNNKGLLPLNKFFAPERKNARVHFEEGKGYTILRNPHLTRNEDTMLMPDLDRESERYKYFKGLNGAIMVNPRSYIAERLSGADYDGDQVRIVKNDIYNNCINKNFNNIDDNGNELAIDKKYLPNTYKEPILLIPHAKAPLSPLNDDTKCTSAKNSFNSRVGQINNTAFRYSLFAYNENISGPDIDEKKKEYAKKAQHLAILTGIEIDSAKSGQKPTLPAKEAAEIQSTYFITYKDNEDRYNTKSNLVESFNDLDVHDINNAINKRHASDVPTIVLPNSESANICILPYLKTFFKKRSKVETDLLPETINSYKQDRTKVESGLFDFDPKENLDSKKLNKLLSLVFAYNQVLNTIASENRYYRDLDNRKYQEFETIDSILKRQSQFDNSNMFKICASKINISYEQACEDIKKMKDVDWIFTLQNDRENVLLSILPEIKLSGLSDEEESKFIEMLCDFSNKGYLLLYYVLELLKNLKNNKEVALNNKRDSAQLLPNKEVAIAEMKNYFNNTVIINNEDSLYSKSEEYYKDLLNTTVTEKAKNGRSYQIKDEIRSIVLNKLLPGIFTPTNMDLDKNIVLKYLDRFKYSYTSTFMKDFLIKAMYDNAKEVKLPQIVLDNSEKDDSIFITPDLNLSLFNSEQSAENLIDIDIEGDIE